MMNTHITMRYIIIQEKIIRIESIIYQKLIGYNTLKEI